MTKKQSNHDSWLKIFFKAGLVYSVFVAAMPYGVAEEDLNKALRRAKYLLNNSMPTDAEFSQYAGSKESYDQAVRTFVTNQRFYDALMRYHQRIFGVGLPLNYMDELIRENIDNRTNKFASITCGREQQSGSERIYRCYWTSAVEDGEGSTCTAASERVASAFWYPGVAVRVCPDILRSCGHDLSQCFISYRDEAQARNSELGATEIFDTRVAVINSLSKQPAGIATAIAFENYPYNLVLEPGLTAIDGAIAHFYRQNHHFRIDQLNLHPELMEVVNTTQLTDSRFRLVKTSGDNYESAGVASTFGWLRAFSKHRTRANMIYERMLCQRFTSELPAVFPQETGDLTTTPGCSGCHAILDPFANFFQMWGEGGQLYLGAQNPAEASFNGQSGFYLSDLALILKTDAAFATCTVQHAWEWLVGRSFYNDDAEASIRSQLATYFITTNYSFRELVYAIATHPTFTEGTRGDGLVANPLTAPPLGQVPDSSTRECTETYTWDEHINPRKGMCTDGGCHSGANGLTDLTPEAAWAPIGGQIVALMGTGSMPRGRVRDGEVIDFEHMVRCWLGL